MASLAEALRIYDETGAEEPLHAWKRNGGDVIVSTVRDAMMNAHPGLANPKYLAMVAIETYERTRMRRMSIQ